MKKFIVLITLFVVLFTLIPYQLMYLLHADEVVMLEPYEKIEMDTIFSGHLSLPFNHVYGHGSGVLIGHRGLILTAGHMVNSSRLMFVKFKSGFTGRAVFVARYSKGDLALLRMIPPSPGFYGYYPGVDMFGWTSLIGDQVWHIGNPISLRWIFTEGRVSQRIDEYTLSTTVVNPGSSGGALYNRQGFLIGICSALMTPSPFAAFAGHSLFVNVKSMRDFLAGWEGSI